MNKHERDAFNRGNIAEFRSNGGKLRSFGEAPVLLLTTIGSRSGQPRTSPMMYLADESDTDRVHVFASAAGADRDPAWYGNVVDHPAEVTVEIGDRTLAAHAEVLQEPARERIFEIQAARYPGFAAYQAKTRRPIPVVALILERSP